MRLDAAHLLNYTLEKKYMDKCIFDNSNAWRDGKTGLHKYLDF